MKMKFKIGDCFLKNHENVGEILQYEGKMFLIETESDLREGDKVTSFFNDGDVEYEIRLIYPSGVYGIVFKHSLNEIFGLKDEIYNKLKIIIFE